MIKNLRSLRLKKGISQQALGNIIGISQQSVNKYENHDVEPDIRTLIKIADYFGVTIDFLVGREELSENMRDSDNNENKIIDKYRFLTPNEKECIDLLLDVLNNRR